jgi:gamma-tubulin complex component 5
MQQKNVIGFFPSVTSSLASTSFRATETDLSSESEESGDDDQTSGYGASVDRRQTTFTMQEEDSRMVDDGDNEDESAQLQKISVDLDNLVRFVRRSVEKIMASGAIENTAAYGVFAFALEDWDS